MAPYLTIGIDFALIPRSRYRAYRSISLQQIVSPGVGRGR